MRREPTAGNDPPFPMKYPQLILTALVLSFNATAFAAPAPGPTQNPLTGLQPGLGTLPLLGGGRTRSISAENPTGEKGKGGNYVIRATGNEKTRRISSAELRQLGFTVVGYGPCDVGLAKGDERYRVFCSGSSDIAQR